MKLRSCANSHFIQAIRDGTVIKVRNTDSSGRPALVYKTLKDVYASEDAKSLGRSPTSDSHDVHASRVKCEIPGSPEAYHARRETVEFFPLADDGSDLDDDTTLKQLKERSLTKKRKFGNAGGNSNQAYVGENPVRDEPDLDEPLINLKSKNSKKSKIKRKHRNRGGFSSRNPSAIKSEPGLVSESSLQVAGELAQFITVKVEVQEAEELGCQSKSSSTEDSSLDYDEGPSPGGVASNNFEKTSQCDYEEPLSSAEENQICVTNEISYDHLDDAQPLSIIFPCDEMSVKLGTIAFDCHENIDFPTLAIDMGGESMEAHSSHFSPSEQRNSDVSGHPEYSSSTEGIYEQNSNSGVPVPDICHNDSINCMGLFEDKSKTALLHEQDDSLSSPEKNCDSSMDSSILLKTDDNIDEEQTLLCNHDDIKKIGLNNGGHMEDELLKAVEKQTSPSSITDLAAKSYTTNQTSDSADTFSSPEPCQPPERLLHPKRKAISPSSQEQLCLALNSVELADDDQYKCKEKLFENQTCKKVSPIKLKIHQVTVNHERPKQTSQRKFITSARLGMKKLQNAKGNLEVPRSSSTRSSFSTGCTSVQGCSESAIAFSQRQMHDMESLAGKLMNELNSLKDIVEQKLLFEAYRSVSLKNDADEVKSAINNATKVEEAAQKWLSMMSRDCNRFCKIMKLSTESVPGSEDPVTRDRKKIRFADEAGGKLCHVKFFEVDATPEMSDAENRSGN